MDGSAPVGLSISALLPPLDPPPAGADLVCLADGGTRLTCRHGPSAPPLPASARAGGGSGDGGGLLPSPRPTAGGPALPPPVFGVTVEATSPTSPTSSPTRRTTPAGPGPPVAWAAASGPWLALCRSPGTVQVLNSATGRLFLHAPAPARRRSKQPATILGGFWAPGPTPASPRLVLVTTDGLDVSDLGGRRGDAAVPALTLALPGTAWFCWNAAAGVCALGTGEAGETWRKSGSSVGGRGVAPRSTTHWAVAYKFSADGSLTRLPPCAPPELSGGNPSVAVLATMPTSTFLIAAPVPSQPAAVLAWSRDAVGKVGSLPAPEASGRTPLFTSLNGLLLRLSPGGRTASVLEVGRQAVPVALASTPPGWEDEEDDASPSPRWSLTPAGTLLDAATGAAWSVTLDPAAVATCCGGGSLAGVAAFHARRQSGAGGRGGDASPSTVASIQALLRAPGSSTAAEVRAVMGVVAETGCLPPAAVAALLSAGAGPAPPLRLSSAAGAYVAALHACGVAWASLDDATAATLDALTRGPLRTPPLQAAALAAGVLPPPTVGELVSAALADKAPLRALRAASGHPLDAATAGAIAAAAVEVGCEEEGGDAVSHAAGVVLVGAVQAACGGLLP